MPKYPQQWKSDPDTAGESGGSAPRAAAHPGSTAGGTEAVLSFEPEKVGRAIVFHMLDEGLAREVAAESVRRTVTRLTRRGLRPAIRRSAWRVMTNHERLEWLLSESLTVPFVQPEDSVVSLEARDAR